MKELEFAQGLGKLSVEDLRGRLEGARRDLFGLRLNAATSHIKDYSQYKKLRREIARILTVIHLKENMLQKNFNKKL